MNKKITLATVAEAAGFSRATVYAVLNDGRSSNISVSEETKKKVNGAISRLGYVPNNAAKTLASGKSYTIGLLLFDGSATFEHKIYDAFSQFWRKYNYTVICDYHDGNVKKEQEKILNFLALGADAIIISRVDPDANTKDLLRFSKQNKPVIILGNELENEHFSYVSFNEIGAMNQIVRHLNELKFEKIAFIGNNKFKWSAASRLNNLKKLLEKSAHISLIHEQNVNTYGEMLELIKSWQITNTLPQAIICYNDRVGVALTHVIRELSIKNLYVIGFDNDHEQFSPNAITSIDFPFLSLAEASYRCFNQTLKDQTLQVINLSTNLVINK